MPDPEHPEIRVVLTNFPAPEAAADAVRQLVREGLAACGNILPGARSIYLWEGHLHDENECVVLLKTTPARRTALEHRLSELHPYETPEILSFAPESVAPAYARWVAESCGARERPQ